MQDFNHDELISKLKEKDTGELSTILSEHNYNEWTDEAFLAIEKILRMRRDTSGLIVTYKKEKDIDKLLEIMVSLKNTISCSDTEREEASLALGRIKLPSLVSKLMEIVADLSKNEFTRKLAVLALGESRSVDVSGDLWRYLGDYNENIRNEVLAALKKINGSSPNQAMTNVQCETCKNNMLNLIPASSYVWVIGYFMPKGGGELISRGFKHFTVWYCRDCYQKILAKKKVKLFSTRRVDRKLKHLSWICATKTAQKDISPPPILPGVTHYVIYSPEEFEMAVAEQKFFDAQMDNYFKNPFKKP